MTGTVRASALVISSSRRTNRTRNFSIVITLLASNPSDRDRVRFLLQKTAWDLVDFVSLEEALADRRALTPIVLCDLNLNQRPWKKLLRMLRAARPGVCVIFLADDCPDPLRQDLLGHGAFDVLTRPLERHALLLHLLFAYSHYKARRRGLCALPAGVLEAG